MSLIVDNRTLPEEIRAELKDHGPPAPPKPPEGQEVFSLPEPDIDWLPELVRKEEAVNGTAVFSARFPEPRMDYVFLHIHGGGFTGGNPVSAYCLIDRLTREHGLDCFSVIYTLVPKAAAPTQLMECLAVYEGLLEMGYERIILAGESAGANLSIALTLELKRRGLPLPQVVIASSPPLDFSGYLQRGDDGHEEKLGAVIRGELAADDWRVSPLFGDFRGFPPLLLQAGELETLRYDSIALGEKLKDTDCDCTLSVWEGGMHAFGIDPGDSWVHLNARQQILDFIRAKCPGL